MSKGCLPFGCLPLPVLQCPHLLQSSPLPLGWGSRCLPLMKGTQPSATLAFICMESFPLCSLNIRMSQQVLGASLLGALEGPQSLGSLRAPLGTRTAGQVGDLPAFWPLGRPAWLALGGSRGSAASQARVGVAQASLQAAFTDDSALVPEARAGSSVSLQPQGWSCMCVCGIHEEARYILIIYVCQTLWYFRPGDNYLFFFPPLFRATPLAYGGFQARGLIRATAAGHSHSRSNACTEPCLQPTPQITAMPDPEPTERGQGLNWHPHGH